MNGSYSIKLNTIYRNAVFYLCIAMVLFHLYTGYAGPFMTIIQRSVHVGFALIICFLAGTSQSEGSVNDKRASFKLAIDGILALLVMSSIVFVVYHSSRYLDARFQPETIDVYFGIVTTMLVLIAAFRVIGWFIPVLSIVLILYAYYGNYFPGIWAHGGLNLSWIFQIIYASTRGLWGGITGISANIISMFVIFGSVLLVTGGGKTFMDFSSWITGSSYGGGGKVATVASALFGTVSGSAGANAATTGTLTIPLMKNLGYKSDFAAGIEASASTGGQLMPPVMGAGAFVMADLLGVRYASIILAALIPAIIFFTGVFSSIHFESLKNNYRGLSRSEVPSIKVIMKPRNSMPAVIPLIVLIYYLIMGYTITTVAFAASISAIVIYLVFGADSLYIRMSKLIQAFHQGALNLIIIVILIACAQIVLSMITATGLGVKLSTIVIGLGQGNIAMALILAMIVSIIVGMGLPTVGAYLLAASVLGPAMIRIGFEPVSAHLFLFYFAIFAGITPPICGSVYITAAIAKADWLKTAWAAIKLSMAGFILPFVFIIDSSYLLKGSAVDIVFTVIAGTIGVISLSAGLMGYLRTKTSMNERVLLIVAALLLLWPSNIASIIGILCIVLVLFTQNRKISIGNSTQTAKA